MAHALRRNLSFSVTLAALFCGAPVGAQPASIEANPVAEPAAAPTPPPVEAQKPEVVAAPSQAPAHASGAATVAGSWEPTGGAIFSLFNILQNAPFLGSYRGLGIAGQYHLDPKSAVRLGVAFVRSSNPAVVRKNTTTEGGDEVVSYQVTAAGPTSAFATVLAADYLMRLSTSSLSPYFGGGLTFGYSQSKTQYTDDLSVPQQVTSVDNGNKTSGFAIAGIGGVEWRLHERFSVFAEYNLSINLVQWNSDHQDTTVEDSSSGTPGSSHTRSESETTRFFNVNLGLAQGGQLGLIVHL
ncbi:MAG: outer membrane beta-barrel protein [Deltaproteobacteria bacterium]|nr:outer membrane beta-barrel protein [Deltaproteobacteria bacterium]